jgi:hypothetical protein
MSAPTYDQLIEVLREFEGKGAPAIEAALVQIYKTPEERYAGLLQHLREMSSDDRLKLPPEGLDDSDQRLAEIEKRKALRVALDALNVQPVEVAAAPVPEPVVSEPELLSVETEPELPELAPTTEPSKGQQSIVRWLFRVIDELGPSLPPLVMLGYLVCFRLADWKTGMFFLSAEEMSNRLGVKDRKTGKKVLRTLMAAGVIRRKVKGHTGRASAYELMPLAHVSRQRLVAGVVSEWWGRNPKMFVQADRVQ